MGCVLIGYRQWVVVGASKQGAHLSFLSSVVVAVAVDAVAAVFEWLSTLKATDSWALLLLVVLLLGTLGDSWGLLGMAGFGAR